MTQLSDIEIRVLVVSGFLFIAVLVGLAWYLLEMAIFLMRRIGRAEDRLAEDATAIDTLTKSLRHTNRIIDKYIPGGVE